MRRLRLQTRTEPSEYNHDLLCLCPSLFIKAHRGALDDVTAGGGIITNISISVLVRFSKKKKTQKNQIAFEKNKQKKTFIIRKLKG